MRRDNTDGNEVEYRCKAQDAIRAAFATLRIHAPVVPMHHAIMLMEQQYADHMITYKAEIDQLTAAVATHAGVTAEIAAERRRQIEIEGWTPAHDDAHANGAMAQAAACYADPDPAMELHPNEVSNITFGVGRFIPKRWPWSIAWWKPKDRRRDLIRAAALIVAEIERLDRASGQASNKALDGSQRPEQGEGGSSRGEQ